MEENTPLEAFEGRIHDSILRLNLLKSEKGSQGQPQGLVVYIQNSSEGFFMEEAFTQDTLPRETITIFLDIPTIFDYIVDHHQDEKRVKVTSDGLMICNVIKARRTQRRQQIILPMTPKPLKKSQAKQQESKKLGEVISMVQEVSESNRQLKRQIRRLNTISEDQDKQLKLLKNKQSSKEVTQWEQLKKQLGNLKLSTSTSIEQINTRLAQQQKYINSLKEELKSEREEKISLKRRLDKILSSEREPSYNGYLLGQKIEITIDTNNKYLKNFAIKDNSVEKIEGDLTRFQLLGNQIMGKVNSSYFEIKIIKLTGGALLIGLTSLSRRGERESHDHRECICLDASGMVFLMGKKEPSIAKLQSGQTVRVHLDLDRSVVRWLVGYTEVASTLLPDYLLNSKLVAYFQINEVGDKIVLN